MFRDVLQAIEGIEIYPIISMIIFLLFFILIVIWAIKLDKKVVKNMKHLPLENNLSEDGE